MPADGSYVAPPLTTTPDEADHAARLRLLRSPRIGPVTWRRLMAATGDAADALSQAAERAAEAGLDGWRPCPEGVVLAELAAASRAAALPVWCDDARYPPALAAIPDAPALVWVRGDPAVLTQRAVAIVGARDASSAGERMARHLATGLAEARLCIVSGLARGIDRAAHEAALRAGGPTVAVLAGGADAVEASYPPGHAALAARIAAEGGALVTEAPMGWVARASDFPRRNRIITGLSRVLVVVEGAIKSGSMSSARLAGEQGREVMAVPGHPFDARAAGPNALIRDGAALARHAGDVIEALDAAAPVGRMAAEPAPARAPDDGRSLPVPGRAERSHPKEKVGAPPSLGHARPNPDMPARATASTRRAARNGPPDDERPNGSGSTERAVENSNAAGSPRSPSGTGGSPVTVAGDPTNDGIASMILDRLASPLDEDRLIRATGLPAHAVAPALLTLELDGRIRRLPGGRVAAC